MEFMRRCTPTEKPDKLYLDPNLIIPEFKEFSEIIDCKICCGIVINPVCCKSCDSIFCKKCINDWISRSKGICPNRCQFQEFEIRRTTINLMNKIKIYCINKEKGCKEEIFYENYSKHLENCDYSQYECIACGSKGEMKIIKSHVNICPKMHVNCEYCCEKFFCKEIEKHYEECQMFEITCRQCNLKIKRYNYERHLELECKEGMISCGFCDAKNIKRKEEHLHTKQVCFENFKKKLISEYENQAQNNNINFKNNNNLVVDKLKNENSQLKKLIEEKDQVINKLNGELNRLKINGSDNRNARDNNIFKDIGHNIKDNVNNLFKCKNNNNSSGTSSNERPKNIKKDGDCKNQ